MATAPQSQPSFTPRRKWGVGFDIVVRTLVVVAVLTMLNHLAGVFFHREYLSAATKQELSERTKNVLQSVTNEVSVTIYYNTKDPFYDTIAALLREYQARNPLIRVETVDYLGDTAEALRIKREFQLPETTEDSEKNFVLFKSGTESRQVPGDFLTDTVVGRNQKTGEYVRRATAFKGETAFTAMLLAVTNPKPLKAYVLQGHGEHDIESGDEQAGYLDFKSLLQQNAVRVEPLWLSGVDPIPADCFLLVIPGPRHAIPESEIQKIEQYLDEGGRLFALFNSDANADSISLERLLVQKWNVLVTDSVVKDTNNAINSIKMAPARDVTIGTFSEHPAVKGLLNFQLNLYAPRVVGEKKNKEAPADAPTVNILFASQPSAELANNPGVSPRSFPLAVAVEKNAVRGVVTARGNTRMIIVGDSFFLANGQMKLFANRDFAHYALNWLLDRPQFAEGIGPKSFTEFRVTLTEAQMEKMTWWLLGAIPGGVLLCGVLVWWRRRK
ncbi:MAG: DUF4350 domain-containing protein [Verrucomicrobiota bacterium]